MSERKFNVKTPDDWSVPDTQLLGFVVKLHQDTMKAVMVLLRKIEPDQFSEAATERALQDWFERTRQLLREDLEAAMTEGPGAPE